MAWGGLLTLGCGSDADALGVGAECASNSDCDTEGGQSCLGFKGGYCGLAGCTGDGDCPESSACITHDDGRNYCFRTCANKPDCNANRSVDNEANCVSSVTWVDGDMGRKACNPPSGS
jgi:hypothetical protein